MCQLRPRILGINIDAINSTKGYLLICLTGVIVAVLFYLCLYDTSTDPINVSNIKDDITYIL